MHQIVETVTSGLLATLLKSNRSFFDVHELRQLIANNDLVKFALQRMENEGYDPDDVLKFITRKLKARLLYPSLEKRKN